MEEDQDRHKGDGWVIHGLLGTLATFMAGAVIAAPIGPRRRKAARVFCFWYMLLGMDIPQKEIRALTSLRGLAAMYVVIYHFSIAAQTLTVGTISGLVPHGYIAVDFFFVLSGFIMGYTYAGAFLCRGLRAFPEFLKKRVARIVPLNTFVVVFIVACLLIEWMWHGGVKAIQGHNILSDLASNLLMLQGLGVGTNLNDPSWSISDEFAAYFLFPALLYTVYSRAGIWFAASIALASLMAITIRNANHGLDSLSLGPAWTVLRCFAEFTFGIVAYRYYSTPQSILVLASDKITVCIALLAAIILALRIGDILVVLLFPFVVVCFARNQGWPSRLIGSRFLHFLGIISFSIYLIQDVVRNLEASLFSFLHPLPVSHSTAVALGAIGSCSVILPAWLTYRVVERPGRTMVKQFLV